jgi:hypothetical protein
MIKNDNKAQMMVLESVLFSITIVISLIFLIQLSPSSTTINSNNINELELIGQNALKAVYNQKVSIESRGVLEISADSSDSILNNPLDKISVCIICDNYQELSNRLNDNIIENNVLYNLYITNASGNIEPVFICSSAGLNELPMTKPVAQANFYVSIDPNHMTIYPNDVYEGENSNIEKDFTEGSTYQIIMRLWKI